MSYSLSSCLLFLCIFSRILNILAVFLLSVWFRAKHSTETVLLSLLSGIYSATDRSHISLLALFDVSAASDMVDHEILLQCLEFSCGLRSSSLLWCMSYLTDRSQPIISGDSRTPWVAMKLGVPLGAVHLAFFTYYVGLQVIIFPFFLYIYLYIR